MNYSVDELFGRQAIRWTSYSVDKVFGGRVLDTVFRVLLFQQLSVHYATHNVYCNKSGAVCRTLTFTVTTRI